MTLLERVEFLAQLHERWAPARSGPGRLVFVEGEAGIGKTTVLRTFAASMRPDAPVYWGACEAMATPRPLGALDDIAIDCGGKLAVARDGGGERHRLFVAFVDLLAERPAVAVLEDVHWADEATLDLLRYAGRRLARTRSLLVASYRNDEVTPSHPLRAVLGDLATAGASRLAAARGAHRQADRAFEPGNRRDHGFRGHVDGPRARSIPLRDKPSFHPAPLRPCMRGVDAAAVCAAEGAAAAASGRPCAGPSPVA